jgi:hypothetical protein
MVFFPPGCVLHGFPAACPVECEAYSTGATYKKYVSPQTPARHRETLETLRRGGRACAALANEKNPHL